MAWRAVFDAQWGRDPVDVTGTWDEARRVLAPQVREGLRDLGCVCGTCRADGEQLLRILEHAEPAKISEGLAEIDGETYRIVRV